MDEPCPPGGSVTSVHLTESCDEEQPRVITHVETSCAAKGDVDVTPQIHQALRQKGLGPKEHVNDTNHAESKQFVESRQHHGIDLVAPSRADNKWQSKAQQGFDAGSFHIDWQGQTATCPAGCQSLSWTPVIDRHDNHVIKIKFSLRDWKHCKVKSSCTTAVRRTITIWTQEHYQALQEVRLRQQDSTF